MKIAQRVVGYLVMTVVVVVFLVAVAAVGLTHTGFGVERTAQFVLDRLERSVHGTMTVGDFGSASLLGEVILRDLEIADTEGRHFVRADSARLGYRLATLLRGSVVFDQLTLWGPDVVIERLPGDARWNYERILSDTTSSPSDTLSDDGDETLILIREATVRDGRVTVRLPWEVEEGSDTSRLMLEDVPGGRVRTLRFDSVNVRLPRVVWESPDTRGKLLEVEDLATRAYVWDTPAEVLEMDATVAIRDSLIDIVADRARLPGSELSSVDARIITGSDGNRYDLEAVGDEVAFRDFQWVYPALPDDGGGTLRFSMETLSPDRTAWRADDARLSSRGSELSGSFGVVTGDTLYFRDVDVRAAPLDLDLAGSLLPDGLPASGLLIGSAAFDGAPAALRTRGISGTGRSTSRGKAQNRRSGGPVWRASRRRTASVIWSSSSGPWTWPRSPSSCRHSGFEAWHRAVSGRRAHSRTESAFRATSVSTTARTARRSPAPVGWRSAARRCSTSSWMPGRWR